MWNYFTDPVLRAPTIGSMLMCMAASLVGVLVFVRKRSLLGESLSHAAYPGIILSVIAAAFLFPHQEDILALSILIGAFISAFLGLFCIDFLEKKFRVKSDAALCFILSAFFGIGVTIASRVQMTHPQEYKQMQVFLFGQAATMTDIHIVIYGALTLLIVSIVALFFKELKVLNFDQSYAKSMGLPTTLLETITYVLIVLAVVVGMRCVGVVLMSAMLIAPAVASRQYTNRLGVMFVLSAFFGLLSGFWGNYFSGQYISLPTGPMIVVVAALICLLSLLFAPRRGIVLQNWRSYLFKRRCACENALKAMWRHGDAYEISCTKVRKILHLSSFSMNQMIRELVKEKLVERTGKNHVILTEKGTDKALHIVRLHRLWEVYLTSYLGIKKERVHKSAEEMEHILTPDLEQKLTQLLGDPMVDPHHQLIPRIKR